MNLSNTENENITTPLTNASKSIKRTHDEEFLQIITKIKKYHTDLENIFKSKNDELQLVIVEQASTFAKKYAEMKNKIEQYQIDIKNRDEKVKELESQIQTQLTKKKDLSQQITKLLA